MKNFKHLVILLVLLTSLVSLAGCKLAKSASGLNPIGSKQSFLKILENYAGGDVPIADGVPELALDGAQDKSYTKDYSKTNVQVEGVDEADIVKTDGEFIYFISQGNVRIIKATPEVEADYIKSLELAEGFYPNELYVDESYLVVIGSHYEPKQEKSMIWYPMHNKTQVLIYDKANLDEVKHVLEFDGYMVSSRKVDDELLLIMNKYIYNYNQPKDVKDSDLLPSYAIDGEESQLSYQDIYYQDGFSPSGVVTAFKIGLSNPKDLTEHYSYLGQAHTIYVSDDHIYIANTIYRYQEGTETETHITKVNYQNGLEVKATVLVKGTISNQFMMDEYEGNFRITTTRGFSWENDSTNNLYIYDDNLSLMGKVEGLAKGESIQSARFVGERIYFVTFRRIDPFFVVDASDPKNPKVLGELKIPGFSSYLHPYDENHVIGFGFEGDDEGVIKGFKMALYNVENPSKPVEKFKTTLLYEAMGYTHSEVTYNHKALLFSKDKNIIGFPLTTSGYEQQMVEENGQAVIRQVYVYRQNYRVYGLDLIRGFELKANISHFIEGKTEDLMYLNEISRGLTINDSLYTLSPSKMMIHDLNTFELKRIVALPYEKQTYDYFYPMPGIIDRAD
jgi:inhibitor of cysteine peptidase